MKQYYLWCVVVLALGLVGCDSMNRPTTGTSVPAAAKVLDSQFNKSTLRSQSESNGVSHSFTSKGLVVTNGSSQTIHAGFAAFAIPLVNGRLDSDISHQTWLAQTSAMIKSGDSQLLTLGWSQVCGRTVQRDFWLLPLDRVIGNEPVRDEQGKPRSNPGTLLPGSGEIDGDYFSDSGQGCTTPIDPPINPVCAPVESCTPVIHIPPVIIPPVIYPPIITHPLVTCEDATFKAISHEVIDGVATETVYIQDAYDGVTVYMVSWKLYAPFLIDPVTHIWTTPFPQTRYQVVMAIFHKGVNYLKVNLVPPSISPAWQVEFGCEPGPVYLSGTGEFLYQDGFAGNY